MQNYELTLVLSPDLTSEKQKTLLDKITKTIEASKGKVAKVTDWGKKQLSYTINKKDHGFYWFLNTQIEESSVSAIDQKVKNETDVMRYLFCKEEVVKEVKTSK